MVNNLNSYKNTGSKYKTALKLANDTNNTSINICLLIFCIDFLFTKLQLISIYLISIYPARYHDAL